MSYANDCCLFTQLWICPGSLTTSNLEQILTSLDFPPNYLMGVRSNNRVFLSPSYWDTAWTTWVFSLVSKSSKSTALLPLAVLWMLNTMLHVNFCPSESNFLTSDIIICKNIQKEAKLEWMKPYIWSAWRDMERKQKFHLWIPHSSGLFRV